MNVVRITGRLAKWRIQFRTLVSLQLKVPAAGTRSLKSLSESGSVFHAAGGVVVVYHCHLGVKRSQRRVLVPGSSDGCDT